jgi:non-ribosomal peptide synthetase component E (peptide arylation enzyme)
MFTQYVAVSGYNSPGRLFTDEQFSYIGDEDNTKAAFDQDGFLKTGDMAELKDGEYVFAGRATTDCKRCSATS